MRHSQLAHFAQKGTASGKEKKRAIGRYPMAFRKRALERLKSCDNIFALSEETGVYWRRLSKWRDRLEAIEDGEGNTRPG
jgi:hypothetical protein